MRVVVRDTAAEAAEAGADLIAALVRSVPGTVLGVATGSSPQPLYAALADRVRAGVDFSRARAFALDEYVGLARAHPESYHSIIRRDVVEALAMDPERVHVPDGQAADVESAAQSYERSIVAAGGVRLQILGIGSNGHLGFNEPGSPPSSRTRVVALAEQTRLDNRRFFAGDLALVPTHALTQGLGTILSAASLLLVAHGAGKAEAVAAALDGPVSPDCPASFLQTHPDVTVLLDRAAASLLRGVAALS